MRLISITNNRVAAAKIASGSRDVSQQQSLQLRHMAVANSGPASAVDAALTPVGDAVTPEPQTGMNAKVSINDNQCHV